MFSLSSYQLANSRLFSDTRNGSHSILTLPCTVSASNTFFLRRGNGSLYHVHDVGFPMQHHGDVLVSSPFLMLPFFTVVEYENGISVEHVYYNSTISSLSGNTTSETIAVYFWMLQRFSSPNSDLQVFQTQYITPFSCP